MEFRLKNVSQFSSFTSIKVKEANIIMPGSPAGITCPRTSVLYVSINALMLTLQKHGVASQIAKVAITSFVATRDMSMAAQAKEEQLLNKELCRGRLESFSLLPAP